MFEVLPNEVLGLIGEYLCYVDITAWRFSCSQVYYNLSPPNITKLVKKELSKYIDREDEFIDLLNTKKAILAGSFMVKVLYNTDWEPGDIDVFEHPEQESEECSSPLEPKTNYAFLSSIIEEETHKTFHDCLPSLCMRKLPISGEKRYISNKRSHKTINYILPLQNITPMRRVYEAFDNDIVKIAYYQNKLYVKDWNKLFVRKSYTVPSYVMWIGCYDSMHSSISSTIEEVALKEMRLRNAKYTERGFTLVNHPQTLSLIQRSTEYSTSKEVNADYDEGKSKNYAYLFTLLDFNKYLDEELD
ncbi:Hypothetical protein BQ3484_465 [Cedratvirus A11]|uniref:Uncharacterized protein n=1 Tax=Cedratvirus A11 TaxID=1903266 RepID=A0A1M7XV19_9VIRU|nr:Hypothetical protein BQ3484_465 [Cedratvirus A11]SHO33533.1 Hypothetical protein BQ3484_465 [Cedratvirus A11]